jgi:arsenate reductase-like glutaredoxin family protein
VDARKQRFGPKDLAELLHGASELVAMKGKRIERFDLKEGAPVGDEAFLKAVLGPSGNLRAPAIRKGKTWLVGFNPEGFEAAFG